LVRTREEAVITSVPSSARQTSSDTENFWPSIFSEDPAPIRTNTGGFQVT